MSDSFITIPARFNGPARSGNGGYVCGRLASFVKGAATVRLRAPPPLERPLAVEIEADLVRLLDGDALLAQAGPATLDLTPPTAPSFDEARAASGGFTGFTRHLIPHCFVCGPQRAEGDGLRIFPGRVESGEFLAAPWVPHASLADSEGRLPPEFLWAALDCAGAFAVMQSFDSPMLLGEMRARLDGTLRIGERCVVTAWSLGSEGRKRYAGTAVYSESGAPVGLAQATWIEVAALPSA